jgi:hypothetical protein
MRHKFEEEKNNLDFSRAMEIYQDVEGSIAVHETELEELQQSNAANQEVDHLKQHINEGKKLLQEIGSMQLQ